MADRDIEIQESDSKRWSLDKEKHDLSGVELSPANIRYGSRLGIVKTATRDLREEREISLESVEALLSRTVEDLERHCEWDDGRPKIQWPKDSEEDKADNSFLILKFPDSEHYSPVLEGNPIFPDGLDDFDDWDAMREVAFSAASRLNNDGKKEVIKWILSLEDKIPGFDLHDFNVQFFTFLEKSNNDDQVFDIVMDYIYQNKDDYSYILSEHGAVMDTHIDSLMLVMGVLGEELSVIKYLSKQTDDEKVKSLLGIFVDQTSFPRVINQIRKYIIETGDKRAERVGRILIGKNPDDEVPFHTQLQNVYKSINFEEYPSNLAASEYEINLIESILNSRGSLKNGVVLDLACGTGRIANGLAKRGFKNIIGIDISEENLQKAKAADKSSVVDYRKGDIKETKLSNDSVDFIVLVGRSSTHAERDIFFYKWMDEIKRILKPNGVILVDFPNPRKGGILQSKREYIQILQKLKIPISIRGGLKNFDYLIDSPDGKNLYNRWVPSIRKVFKIFNGGYGFDIQILDRQPIRNERGDENIYFLAENKRKYGLLWKSTGRLYKLNLPEVMKEN